MECAKCYDGLRVRGVVSQHMMMVMMMMRWLLMVSWWLHLHKSHIIMVMPTLVIHLHQFALMFNEIFTWMFNEIFVFDIWEMSQSICLQLIGQ